MFPFDPPKNSGGSNGNTGKKRVKNPAICWVNVIFFYNLRIKILADIYFHGLVNTIDFTLIYFTPKVIILFKKSIENLVSFIFGRPFPKLEIHKYSIKNLGSSLVCHYGQLTAFKK